jgi:hypothetical protein
LVALEASPEELVEPASAFDGIPSEGLCCGFEIVDLGQDASPDFF